MNGSSTLRGVLLSSVARKLVSTLTGLGLVVFLILHLAGNLTLLIPGGEVFNQYALKLKDFGPLFYVGEAGLAFLIALHAVQGILLKVENGRARGGVDYRAPATKGGPSRSGLSSLNMAFTGILLLAFIIIHVAHFRLGPAEAEGYVTTLGDREARDLFRLIVETFGSPIITSIYTVSMVILFGHLRHGIWSAFQSLGLLKGRASTTLHVLSAVVAVLLAMGFVLLPVYLHFVYKGVAP
jgi:succinate dehydrogenase / fumarate reductase cytochrome b subunit